MRHTGTQHVVGRSNSECLEILDSFNRPTERQLQTWNNSLVKTQTVREVHDLAEQDGHIDALGQGDRCSKCGSRKHQTNSCTVDLSKTKCFRCGTFGHISAHCPKKQHEKGDERARPIGRHHQKPSKQQRQTKQNPKTQNTKANHTVLTCTTLK